MDHPQLTTTGGCSVIAALQVCHLLLRAGGIRLGPAGEERSVPRADTGSGRRAHWHSHGAYLGPQGYDHRRGYCQWSRCSCLVEGVGDTASDLLVRHRPRLRLPCVLYALRLGQVCRGGVCCVRRHWRPELLPRPVRLLLLGHVQEGWKAFYCSQDSSTHVPGRSSGASCCSQCGQGQGHRPRVQQRHSSVPEIPRIGCQTDWLNGGQLCCCCCFLGILDVVWYMAPFHDCPVETSKDDVGKCVVPGEGYAIIDYAASPWCRSRYHLPIIQL